MPPRPTAVPPMCSLGSAPRWTRLSRQTAEIDSVARQTPPSWNWRSCFHARSYRSAAGRGPVPSANSAAAPPPSCRTRQTAVRKTTLGPQEKRQSHAKRLSAADCPIADDGLPTVLPPPGQHLPLLAGKPDHIISHSSLPFPPAAPPAPEAADPPAGVRWPPTASTASLTPGPGPPA